LASAAIVAVLATTGQAKAQEVQVTGPLKGAPAVRHLRLYRQGRLEISPTVAFSLLDEYRRTILVGANLNYAITDWLAIGVWGGYAGQSLSPTTDLTERIDAPTGAPHNQETANNVNHTSGVGGSGQQPFGDQGNSRGSFAAQTAYIDWIAAPQLTFIPFRGKLAIFNKIFVDSDLYLAAGAAFVGLHERGHCGASGQLACSDPNSFALTSQTKIAPTFGIGFRFYPGNFWSLGVEYRAVPFDWNRAGFDSRGTGPNGNFPDGKVDGQDDTFKFNMFVTVSVGFYLPTIPKVSD
jgi:outer membrane beta-barrel protein